VISKQKIENDVARKQTVVLLLDSLSAEGMALKLFYE